MPSREEELKELAELEELASLEAEAAGSGGNQESSIADKALAAADYAGRGLDYFGGAVRGGIAGAAELATGRDDLVNIGDVLKGKAPTSAEVMGKLGVPEGYSLSDIAGGMYSDTGEGLPLKKGGMLDPSVRGAAGLAMDIATDPLTYLSMGASGAAKAAKAAGKSVPLKSIVMNPIGEMAGNRSKSLYKKAFEKVDKSLVKENMPHSIGEILEQQGFRGSMEDAAHAISDIHRKSGEGVGSTLKKAAELGAQTDLYHAFDPAMESASKFRTMGSPEAAKLAEEIDNRISYMADKYPEGKIPVDVANEEKAFLNDLIKKSGFAASDEATISTKAKKEVSSSLAKDIPESVKSVDQDLYERLKKDSDMYRSTNDEAMEKMLQQAKTDPNLRKIADVTGVDMMLAGSGAMTGGAGWAPFILKKGRDIMTSTQGRTNRAAFGKMLEKNAGIVDPALRQALWIDMLKEENKNEK